MDVESTGDQVQLGEAGRGDRALVPLDRAPLESGLFGKVVL